MLIDLDHFKEFNDTYGHGKGDEVLRIVAQELNHNLRRAGDFVARFGGEEFVALLPYADEEHVNKASQQIHNAIRELNIPHKSSPVSDHLTVSIGVLTVNSKDFESTQQIFEKVDQIMYEAKRQGRNRVVTF